MKARECFTDGRIDENGVRKKSDSKSQSADVIFQRALVRCPNLILACLLKVTTKPLLPTPQSTLLWNTEFDKCRICF